MACCKIFKAVRRSEASLRADPQLEKSLGTGSKVFKIESMGLAGDSVVKITTVIDFTSTQDQRTGGKVLYWRVD